MGLALSRDRLLTCSRFDSLNDWRKPGQKTMSKTALKNKKKRENKSKSDDKVHLVSCPQYRSVFYFESVSL